MRNVTPEMRNLSGLNQLTGNDDIIQKIGSGGGAEAARSAATDSTQVATTDYMDRINNVVLNGNNSGAASQPVQGAGGMTNHALGSMISQANNSGAASNLNNNSNMNAAAAAN